MSRRKAEIDAGKVEHLASIGSTVQEIADCIGIARSTFYRRMEEREDIQDALKRGRSKGLAVVENALFQAAKNGNVTAMIFYLKNRAPDRWRDRREYHVSEEGKSASEYSTSDLVALVQDDTGKKAA
jgi:hypothetical protein